VVGQVSAIVRVAGPDSMGPREQGLVAGRAVEVWVLDPLPGRAQVSGAVETPLVIAVSHRVRAATLLGAPSLAEALRDQPAVEEVIAWAAVASAVADAAVVAEVAAEVGDKQRRKTMNKNVKTNSSSAPFYS
jgi:hypothetical protein